VVAYQDWFQHYLADKFGRTSWDLGDAMEACRYLHWADLHEVELTLTYTQNDLDICTMLLGKVDQYFLTVDN
jgi:hypothetical protein